MGRQLNLNPLDAALVASNAALFAFYKSIERTIDVTFREPLVPKTTRPIIYITWHRQNYVATPVFRKLAKDDRPTFIAHDGVASRVWRVGKKMEHLVPRRNCRIEVRRGELLDAKATAEDCQRALDARA